MRILVAVMLFVLITGTAPHDSPVLKNVASRTKVQAVAEPTPKVETPAPVVETPEPPQPAPTPEPAPVETPAPTPVPTSHEELMAAAGISQSDWPAVDYIVTHESGWNQDATEPNSGAHGLVQALPFSKTGCGWEDAVCTLVWGQQYAIQRYGGWWGAYSYWVANHNW